MMLIMFYFEGRSIIIENSFESLSSSIYYCFWYISWNSADRYIPFLVQRLYWTTTMQWRLSLKLKCVFQEYRSFTMLLLCWVLWVGLVLRLSTGRLDSFASPFCHVELATALNESISGVLTAGVPTFVYQNLMNY